MTREEVMAFSLEDDECNWMRVARGTTLGQLPMPQLTELAARCVIECEYLRYYGRFYTDGGGLDRDQIREVLRLCDRQRVLKLLLSEDAFEMATREVKRDCDRRYAEAEEEERTLGLTPCRCCGSQRNLLHKSEVDEQLCGGCDPIASNNLPGEEPCSPQCGNNPVAPALIQADDDIPF